jgi:hypothetical protein
LSPYGNATQMTKPSPVVLDALDRLGTLLLPIATGDFVPGSVGYERNIEMAAAELNRIEDQAIAELFAWIRTEAANLALKDEQTEANNT